MWKWLRNPKVATSLAFLVVVALIWFAGPYFGLESAEARAGWVFGVMLLWVVILMAGKLIADRAGSLLERMLRRQADDAVMAASADKRVDVSALRANMLSAIETLKKSELGKSRGKAALYELPWYMVIGHASAGKSSAILNSGLTFPFERDGTAAVQGIGGTRNCDWFFASEGVLLDTAGRYSTQQEDRPEWMGFLKLLKKYRSRAPVNGVLVALSLPELMQWKTEAFATYARQVRERINELEDAFGIKVPIYLVITKTDLLGGFSQFFEDLPPEQRGMVWGATLTHEQGTGFDAARVVGQHYDALIRGLTQTGLEKLALNRGKADKPALFSFPIELNALKEPVCRFVQFLFENDPYHTHPLLRGFYFTSALQEGSPRIAAGHRVSSQFELTRPGFEAAQVPTSQSFFLRDLFREVIFPDQHLVSRQTRPNRSRARIAAIAAGLALLGLLGTGWTWSFVGNQKLIASARTELAAAQQGARSLDLGERLRTLHVLQQRIAQLYQYRQEGRPFLLGLGLYRGADIERQLRTEYFAGVRQLMLAPVKSGLESRLGMLTPAGAAAPAARVGEADRNGFIKAGYTQVAMPQAAPAQPAENLDDAYNALKTYLMLHERERLEASHLAAQLPRYWKPWLEANRGGRAASELNPIAEQVVAFYLSQLKEPDLPLIENQTHLVANSRDVLRVALRRLSAKERIYSELKARANTKFAPMTVARMLNNQYADVMAGSEAVPGAFTREAWEKYFQNAILEASRGDIKGDDWVLAISMQATLGAEGDVERNRQALEVLYKAEYAEAWQKFLQGVVVRDFASLQAAPAALTKLADARNSPLRFVLARAAYETSWDNPNQIRRSLDTAKVNVMEKAQRLLSDGRPVTQVGGVSYGALGAQFAGLQAFVGDGQSAAPIDEYLAQLAKIKLRLAGIAVASDPAEGARQMMLATFTGAGSEIADAGQWVDNGFLAAQDANARTVLRPVLVRPLLNSFAALIVPVEEEVNREWAQEVYGAWKNLAAKYPFADSQNEAPMNEIARFLKPGDGILTRFVDKQLAGLVTRRGETITPRTWANLGIRLNPIFLAGAGRLTAVGGSILQDGDGTRFELQPIPTPGFSEILIEIDGQTLRYRNGPQPWTTFAWPNATQVQGARLQVVSFSGVTTPIAHHTGRMGLMRMLSQARANQASAPVATLEWRFKPQGQREESVPIRFNFRAVSGPNPLVLAELRRLTLPERITN